MHLSIGYQLPDEQDSTYNLVEDFAGTITNVYFAAPGWASARMTIDFQAECGMIEELKAIRDRGVTLTLLINANCYGGQARSRTLQERILKTIEKYVQETDISSVTTTSPFAAQVVKKAFPGIRTCASVNMWIGTERAMEILSDSFDDFYLQREYNRNFEAIRRLKKWCDQHDKGLKLLANSGCLYACPFHTFHDNLVAHDDEASTYDNAMSKNPSPCWDYLEKASLYDAAAAFLSANWIRPEDIAQYEPYFPEVKLATRMHSNPRRVISAYARGRFMGNMLDLTEPSYARRFDKYIMDATLFPPDWLARTGKCAHECETCGYCKSVAQQTLITKMELGRLYLC